MAASKAAILDEVRQSVELAARKLASLGGEYQRSSWLLEDALEYLCADAENGCATVSVADILDAEADQELDASPLQKAANG